MKEIKVSMGDYAICYDDEKITTFLGSCIAIVLIGKNSCALAHCILPSRAQSSSSSHSDQKLEWMKGKKAKYVDEAIIALSEIMNEPKLKAHLYGSGSMMGSKIAVGQKNREEAVKQLKKLKIPIIESELGGTNAKFVSVDCKSKKVVCRDVGYDLDDEENVS